jgi:predicted permease
MLANLGLIFFCISLGWVLKRTRLLPPASPRVLNALVLNISLPAVALLSLHDIAFGRALFFPVSMAWILFALSCVFFGALGRFLGWKRQTIGALILTGGLANTSFVGFPLLTALYGPQSLRIGVLTDQPGSFLVLSSLGLGVASLLSARQLSPSIWLGRLLRFPPFLAMGLALALHSWPYPDALKADLKIIAAPLVPLALISVGMQLELAPALLRRNSRELAIGLLFKLIVAPALICALFVGALGARGQDIQITIVQAAMAPMITGAILAADHGLEPELANLMIGAGIPLSLLTVPLWAYLLRAV